MRVRVCECLVGRDYAITCLYVCESVCVDDHVYVGVCGCVERERAKLK